MKRDMDVVRSILLQMEESSDSMFMTSEIIAFASCENANEAVGYFKMLVSGGFLSSTQEHVYSISWEGFEFLDKIRDPEIWGKTKASAAKLGSFSVTVLGELATGYIKAKAAALGLPLV